MIELYITNLWNNQTYSPIVTEGITWTTERQGVPGKLTFTVIKDGIIDFHEGNPVRFTVNGTNLFFGFVFKKSRDKSHHIEVTAYDQLRYLVNKDTLQYRNKTASDVIRMIAAEYRLELGTIEQTGHVIAECTEQNKSLFDIVYNALDAELLNRGIMYVFYDDFGRLTLKTLDSMKLDLLIDEETGENFDYSTSIDDETYNRVKLTYHNKDTGILDIYHVQDGNNINNWGILQFHDSLQEGENGELKANAILSLYNQKTRKLKIHGAFGDVRVRAGSLIGVKLGLGDINTQNYMLVEKVEHTFDNDLHQMNLTLRGVGGYAG